jgi:hypothetical protein
MFCEAPLFKRGFPVGVFQRHLHPYDPQTIVRIGNWYYTMYPNKSI